MGLAESSGKFLLVPEIKMIEAGPGQSPVLLSQYPGSGQRVWTEGRRSRAHQRSPKVHLPREELLPAQPQDVAAVLHQQRQRQRRAQPACPGQRPLPAPTHTQQAPLFTMDPHGGRSALLNRVTAPSQLHSGQRQKDRCLRDIPSPHVRAESSCSPRWLPLEARF